MRSESQRPAAGGLVLVDKEPGPSSFAVVKRVRARHRLKAGHAGTLDPFASGLLLCLVGRSTRLARYLVGLDKRYEATIRLGSRTGTGDTEGEETEQTEVPGLAQIEALRGVIELPIPAASAVKIDGERAYRLHRQGVAVDMPMRCSTVHELSILRYEPPELELDLLVSSGTYIRAIAHALGGHCTALRRTEVGSFSVAQANEECVLPPAAALANLPWAELTPEEANAVVAGRAVPSAEHGAVVLLHDGAVVAVAQSDGSEARPETVIA